MPLCKAVTSSQAIPLERLCWLSFKTCWVNLLRPSMCTVMLSKPKLGVKTAAKQSYQWGIERAHLVLRRVRVAALGSRPGCAYLTCCQGMQHSQAWGCGSGMASARPGPTFFVFQCCVLHSRYNIFQQEPGGDWILPLHPWVWSNSCIPAGYLIVNSTR